MEPLGDRGGAYETNRVDSGLLDQRIDGFPVPLYDIQGAARQSGLPKQVGQEHEADGSRSEGLSTNEFPHASAIGNIQIGTIAGQLNGVMPATTPTGCRML